MKLSVKVLNPYAEIVSQLHRIALIFLRNLRNCSISEGVNLSESDHRHHLSRIPALSVQKLLHFDVNPPKADRDPRGAVDQRPQVRDLGDTTALPQCEACNPFRASTEKPIASRQLGAWSGAISAPWPPHEIPDRQPQRCRTPSPFQEREQLHSVPICSHQANSLVAICSASCRELPTPHAIT